MRVISRTVGTRSTSEDDFLRWSEIAALCGVEVGTVQAWAKKDPEGFPQVVERDGNRPLRRWGDVLDWLTERAEHLERAGQGAWASQYRAIVERHRPAKKSRRGSS